MVKFQRNYELSVQPNVSQTAQIPYVFRLPLTIEFDIQRNSLASSNTATIRIYNLNQVVRRQLARDYNDFGAIQAVILKAGYGDKLSVIFTGNVSHAYSYRQGVDYITELDCFDGGAAYAQPKSDFSYEAGTEKTAIIQKLMQDLVQSGVSVGRVGSFPGSYSKGGALSGNTFQLLQEETGGGVFVDNGTVHAINSNECLPGSTLAVNTDGSLLSTPIRENTRLTFDILFEPKLAIGQQITLNGDTDNFGGVYKVVGLKHRGTISLAVCGEAITTVTAFIGSALNGGTFQVIQ